MTTYILILYITSGHAGGPATVEFDSFEACQFAATAAEAKFDTFIGEVTTLCIPKGKL
jgi:hypothetical protein